MSHLTCRWHVTPATNVQSVLSCGLLPSLARGSLKAVWLVSRCRLTWAVRHVRKRHGVAEVAVISVRVDRASLIRRRRGVWSTATLISPSQIVSVRPPAFVGAA